VTFRSCIPECSPSTGFMPNSAQAQSSPFGRDEAAPLGKPEAKSVKSKTKSRKRTSESREELLKTSEAAVERLTKRRNAEKETSVVGPQKTVYPPSARQIASEAPTGLHANAVVHV
jgi:hypothetical protein